MAQATNLDAIHSALVTLVSGVSGIANVKRGARLTLDWGTYVEQFRQIDGSSARVNGWTVQWISTSEERASSLENRATHRFMIRGHYSLREYSSAEATTSEQEFDAIVRGILDAVRATHDMSGTADLSAPANNAAKSERIFGDVLVHYCEITVEATEYLLGD